MGLLAGVEEYGRHSGGDHVETMLLASYGGYGSLCGIGQAYLSARHDRGHLEILP